jgi:hypothetical protein
VRDVRKRGGIDITSANRKSSYSRERTSKFEVDSAAEDGPILDVCQLEIGATRKVRAGVPKPIPSVPYK